MNGSAVATIVYDGGCRMCTRCIALLLRYDVAHSLRATPGGEDTRERFGTTDMNAMYVIADGRRYCGYWAFQAVFDRLPRLRGLARSMRFGPLAAAGNSLYPWVADHRGALRWIVPALDITLRLAHAGVSPARRSSGRKDGAA